MRSVGVKRLKDHLSEYVRLANGGETVLVTDRDLVVAELVPPRADRTGEVSDALLADLVRRGWLTPAAIADGSPPPRAPSVSWAVLAQELDDDRADR